MNRHSPSLEPQDTAKESEFRLLAVRLKDDHDDLKSRVEALYQSSLRTASVSCRACVARPLEELQAQAAELLNALSCHADWEDHEFFSILFAFYKERAGYSLLPSLIVLEKDHELALDFFRSFLKQSEAILIMLERGMESDCDSIPMQVKRASDQLTQACLIMKGHFDMEESLIFPIAEDILTAIDYLFS